MFSLQHDTGRTCTEYTWSAEDGMWGVRLLHNFGKLATPVDTSEEGEKAQRDLTKVKRVDEEEAMEGGLKGRISAGAEFYFSAKEKSAGGSWMLGSFVHCIDSEEQFPQESGSPHFQMRPPLPSSCRPQVLRQSFPHHLNHLPQ